MDLAAHSTVSVLGRGASSSPVTYRGGAMSVESVQFYGARKDDSEEMDYVRLKIPRSGHLTYIDLTHYTK